MKYKLLCTDLDGTLLSTKSDVSNFTVSEISKIKDRLKVILVSARMPKAITYLQERLGIAHMPIICYNGALVMDGATQIYSAEIPIQLIESIHQLAEENSIQLGLFNTNEWYTSEHTDSIENEINCTRTSPVFRSSLKTIEDWKIRGIGAHKIMLMAKENVPDSFSQTLQKKFDTGLIWYRSNDRLIEIAPKGTSKLQGIELLLEKGETLKEVIAFGDNYNDIEMLRGVGCGVAVGNAVSPVKAIADRIALRNTESGVAHFIKHYLAI